MAAAAPRLPAAARDRYVDLQLLGRGGMGEVWRARDLVLARDVALKCFLDDRAEARSFRQRLAREVKTLALVNHPNVVRVFDWLQDGESATIVMEFVPGTTLRSLLDEGPLAPAHAARLLAQAAEGLHAVHQAGLVHRDLKPENLMVTPDDQVKVMDFGLVAFHDAATVTALTRTGTFVGTPLYLPPEFLEGKPATPRCDVFQLGLVLHLALTGDVPLRGREALRLLLNGRETISGPYEGPAAARLDPDLVAIGRRAAEVDPARRFPAAQSLAQALRGWLAGERRAPPPAPTTNARARAPRLLAWLAAGLALAAALLAVVAWRRPAAVGPPRPAGASGGAPRDAARAQYLRLLDDFVALPRPRASDVALRRPPPAAGAAWARGEVERRLRRSNQCMDWDEPPEQMDQIEEAATGFLGLVDLLVRLPAEQQEERDRSLALVVELTRFFELRLRRVERVRRAARITAGVGLRALSLPLTDRFVGELRAIVRREEEDGRGHPSLALLDAFLQREEMAPSACLARLEAAALLAAGEPWRRSPALARFVGLYHAERAQALRQLGKTDELRASAASAATSVVSAAFDPGDALVAGFCEAQVSLVDHLLDLGREEALQREAVLLVRRLLAQHASAELVPLLHAPLLKKLQEHGLADERAHLERAHGEVLRQGRLLSYLQVRGLLP